MTGREIFALGYGMIPMTAEDVEDYDDVTVTGWLNVLLAEALDTENSIRAFEGREPLAQAPVLAGPDDPVPYADSICRRALPYGLAAWLWTDEDEEYRVQDYRGRYVSGLSECAKAVSESVVDVYA